LTDLRRTFSPENILTPKLTLTNFLINIHVSSNDTMKISIIGNDLLDKVEVVLKCRNQNYKF